jgi:hypothetical protein
LVRNYEVNDQFGRHSLDIVKPDILMVPSVKNIGTPPTPAPPAISHFQCYRVKLSRVRERDVNVVDQFGALTVDVLRPLRLCTPVEKNGEPVLDAVDQLMCYQIRQTSRPRVPSLPLFIDNQFGTTRSPSPDRPSSASRPDHRPGVRRQRRKRQRRNATRRILMRHGGGVCAATARAQWHRRRRDRRPAAAAASSIRARTAIHRPSPCDGNGTCTIDCTCETIN